jgi:uracil DNA glycosylase
MKKIKKNQSDLFIDIMLINNLKEKDPYFLLRMGLRPDLHQKIYPKIPIILSKKEEVKKEEVKELVYGEDPYKKMRMFFPHQIDCVFC